MFTWVGEKTDLLFRAFPCWMQLYSHPNLFIPSLSCGMSLPVCHEGRQGISALRWGCHKQEQILAAYSPIGDILICRWWLEWGSSDLWTGLILIWLKLFNWIFILAGPTKPILLPLHNQSGFRGPVLQLSWSNQSIELCAISLPIVELNCRLQSFNCQIGWIFWMSKGSWIFFPSLVSFDMIKWDKFFVVPSFVVAGIGISYFKGWHSWNEMDWMCCELLSTEISNDPVLCRSNVLVIH